MGLIKILPSNKTCPGEKVLYFLKMDRLPIDAYLSIYSSSLLFIE